MRAFYLDNIRYFTIIAVVIFHVFYMYNGQSIPGVLGSFYDNQIQDVFQYILYPWIMIILFIISGISSNYYLKKYDNFIRDRTVKLLVPASIGLLVFGWTQGYYNMLLSDAFSKIDPKLNKFIIFLIMCLSGTGVLWFNQVLWISSVILKLLIKIEKNRILNYFSNVNFITILSLGFGLWLFAQILNTPIIVVYRFGVYGYAYFLGYFVFSHQANIKYLESNWIFLSLISIFFGALYIYKYFGQNFASKEIFGSVLSITYSWFICLAIFGIGKKFFDKEYSFSKFMRKYSYGIYIFHYLFLSSTAYYLHEYTNIRPLFHYITVCIASFVGSILLYSIMSRIPIIRWCVLGISENKRKKVGK
jgi:peptidoglycan/LPS O-acetylase OafA/YrhL